jgi:hypothetical protein
MLRQYGRVLIQGEQNALDVGLLFRDDAGQASHMLIRVDLAAL